MSYKSLTREWKEWRHDDLPVVPREATLQVKGVWLVGHQWNEKRDEDVLPVAYHAVSRSWGRGMV